ncbi:MAG: serine hydrolase domain-containing protein [Chloroflexota bacterium]
MLDQRINAVENGLLTANFVNGVEQPSGNLIDRMEFYHVPGVSISVINHSQIEWSKGYGVGEAGLDSKVTTGTLFQAASISKPVAAIAALELVEQGKLDLDGEVNQWLSSWKIPENEYTQKSKVTLRRILSHTAGLTVHGFPGYSSSETVPTLLQVLKGEHPANTDPIQVNIEPGSINRYSGGGYTVVQQLLEDITGKPFQEFLKNTVLEKLSMNDSTFEQPLANLNQNRAATAHNGAGFPIPGKWHTYPEKAAAGLWTTPTDLARFLIEIMQSSIGLSNKLLSVGMANEMLTPQNGNFGLGLEINKDAGEICRFGHGGSNQGFRCYMVAYKETGQGAVVMTNSDNGDMLIMEIIRGIAHIYGWADFHPEEKTIVQVNPDTLTQFAGKYQLADWPEFVIQVQVDNSRLVAENIPAALRYELYPESKNKYFALETELTIEFTQDDHGSVNALMLGPNMKMEKIK